MCEPTGVHIAFAAGTGTLTFMDLVAQIALRVMNEKRSTINENTEIKDSFRFIFYVSFPS